MSENLDLYYGPNAGYVIDLYEQYLRDPASVDADTRAAFADWTPEGSKGAANGFVARAALPPPTTDGATSPAPGPTSAARLPRPDPAPTALNATIPRDVERIARLSSLARSIRSRGHQAARLDPLATEEPHPHGLDARSMGIEAADLREVPPTVVGGPLALDAASAGEAIEALRAVYCATTGYDYAHIQVAEERAWLRDAVESGRFRRPLDAPARRALLSRLTEVEAFEHFLQRKYTGQKRFSIEGTDMLVPIIDAVIHSAATAGTRDVVMGMAHRGRLNVLAHILGKPYAQIFTEFEHGTRGSGAAASEHFAHYGWTGDVKYHLGARTTVTEGDTLRVQVTLAPNPSHLEFVNPVIQGMARALQETRTAPGYPVQDSQAALAILIHGDAAFPGEGVVAESLNISRLAGYRVGGTVHIIANNGLGFTTGPEDARSTLYASDLAKGFEIPIVHVNADDPEACVAAATLAYAYHARFGKDFLIDLVGYRRYGHNEADEPAFTQPLIYEQVRKHPSARALWAESLAREGVVAQAESDAMLEAAIGQLQGVQPVDDDPHTEDAAQAAAEVPIDTAVPADRLQAYNEALLARPEGFTPHPKVEGLLAARRAALGPEGTIGWAHAESLALASLLADGTPIRLTGQDTERGTFSQRHLVLHDVRNGARYLPLHALPQARAALALYNSPLSESAALGFEYGYGGLAGEVLVLWEAQYGDFANAAQVIIDQFISSARAKWRERPWLVLLLPHGYEGQGPEHSNARPERFLQLAGGDNLRVANCTTAAQYFHLLRRQVALREIDPRPLILMTPKSLLRLPAAASRLAELTGGSFRPVIDDPSVEGRRSQVTRLVLCSGKVYYELAKESGRAEAERVAIARVEQLYPFPDKELGAVIGAYPALREVIWLQEEPKNMGAWSYMAPRLRDLIGREPSIDYVGRPDRASPAEGSPVLHRAEQDRILAEAFSNLQGLPAVAQEVK